MKNQYWGSIHVLPDQTQTSETDARMREFLSSLHFKSPRSFLDDVGKWYNGLSSSYSSMFLNVGYVDKYTNLPATKDFHVSIYGVSGIHNIRRISRYINYYVSKEETLLGQDFFPYIFDSFYFSEEEARDTSENVTTLLDKKVSVDKKRNAHIEIKEKDRDLICHIVERLWSSQIEDVGTRLVLCINEQEIQSRSEELLKQIYLLLPQKLRMNMGFCTNSNPKDIAYLSGECELPVHIFTMKVEDIEKTKQEFAATEFKYPVVLFDVENPEKEVCDPQRLKLIEELSYKLSPTSDAKLAYAEKRILQEERGAQVSFKNLQKIFERLNSKGFCWWERDDLESIEDIFHSYQDQQEMMDNEVLKKEAIDTFYQKLFHKMMAEYRDRDRIVKKAIQNLLSENRWLSTAESSTTEEVLEEGRVTILEKQREISVFEIIKEYTVLPESSVDITRAEINARKIKNFEQSFIKAEKVEQGLLELESSFRGYFQWIREKTQKYLLDYGPVVAKRFLYGDRNNSGVLERIKAELKKQIEENIPERKRRPVRQIVGLMTEAEEQKKIALWKEDFHRALESEIAVEIVKQFLEQGDDGTVFSEIQKYGKRVSELAEYLENAKKQEENPNNGRYEVIEGIQDAEIEKWADNRIEVWLRRDQICEKIRQKIVNIILSGPVDVEKTAEAEIEGNVTEKAGITVEHCIEETNQECGVEIVKKLLEQSRPMLNMDTRDKNRCAYIFLPEELARKEKWTEILETCRPWFPQMYIETERTKNTEKISCIQTSLANSVYDWKKMQPELKNITLERSAVSKTAEQTKQNVQTRANEQSAKNVQTNRKAAESSDQNVSQSFRKASENAEKTASEPVRLNPRFCKFCGAQLKKGTEKFCPLCGKSLYRK